jgi:DNA-binding XRE family transcriptional regulator
MVPSKAGRPSGRDQTINSIEKGRFHPNLRLALKIARAFGKQIAEVFIYDDV